MSAALLKEIDSHAETLLRSELVNPTVPAGSSVREIAGFEIPDDEFAARRREVAVTKRRETVAGYYRMKAELTEILENDLGVTPLAYLPTRMFELVVKNAGLYSLPESMRTEVNPTHFLLWTQGNPCVKNPVAEYTATHGRSTVMKHLLNLEFVDIASEDDMVRKIMREKAEAGDFRAQAWFRFNEIEGRPAQKRGRPTLERYDLALPVPPKEVHEAIILSAPLHPRTVAVHGAISFKSTTLEAVLFKALNNQLRAQEEAEKRADWILHDPIVYVQRGSITAVIAQFGPFPVEVEMVRNITAAEFLPG